MREDTVACIIVNFNDFETTERLLQNIIEYQALNYIVVVDNCSTDNSFEKLQKYASEHTHVIKTERNGGYGYGNNIGIRYVKEKFDTEYVVITNPDVFFDNDIVIELRDFLSLHKEFALVSGINGDARKCAWKEITLLEDLMFQSVVLNKIFKPVYYRKEFFAKEICEVYAIAGCFFVARLAALFDIGLYDEAFFLYMEELVIAKKLKENGWKSAILPQNTYIHNHSVTVSKNIKSDKKRKELVLNSHSLYLSKYRNVSAKVMKMIRIYYKYALFENTVVCLVRKNLEIFWKIIKTICRRNDEFHG